MITFKSLTTKAVNNNLTGNKVPVMTIIAPEKDAKKKYYTIGLNKVLANLLEYTSEVINANTRILMLTSNYGELYLLNEKYADKIGLTIEDVKKESIISKIFTINNAVKTKKLIEKYGYKPEDLVEDLKFVGYKLIGDAYDFPIYQIELVTKEHLITLESDPNAVFEKSEIAVTEEVLTPLTPESVQQLSITI